MDPEAIQMTSDEARSQWRQLLNDVEHHGEHITISRYGKPSAVLVSHEWYEQAKAALVMEAVR